MIDPKDLSALGGAAGALIAALSYWAKTRHERRRATRTVLYYLLELHHVVHRVRVGVVGFKACFVRELQAALERHGMRLNEEDIGTAMKQLGPELAKFGRMVIEGSIAENSEAMTKGLAELAKEDPVLAFRLRGRDQFMLIPKKLEAFAAGRVLPPSDADQQQTSFLLDVDDLIASLTLEELESAIRATAWRCDLITHFNTRKVLRKAAGVQPVDDLKDIISQLVETYVSAIAAQVKAGKD